MIPGGIALEISAWYRVTYDAESIALDVRPPNGEPWTRIIRWETIVRVCFEAGDFLVSDSIYLFTADRPESYVLPTEADGGAILWAEIIRRGLFDAELAISVMTAEPGIYCHPR